MSIKRIECEDKSNTRELQSAKQINCSTSPNVSSSDGQRSSRNQSRPMSIFQTSKVQGKSQTLIRYTRRDADSSRSRWSFNRSSHKWLCCRDISIAMRSHILFPYTNGGFSLTNYPLFHCSLFITMVKYERIRYLFWHVGNFAAFCGLGFPGIVSLQ